MRPHSLVAAVAVIMLGLPAVVRAESAVRGWGLEGTPAEAAVLAAALPEGSPDRLLVRLDVEGGAAPLEDEASSLAAAVAAAAPRATVVVALREGAPVDVRDGAAVDDWAERVATLVDRTGGRVRAWVIGRPGGTARAPEEEAFFLKRTALAIKGVDRRALVLTAEPASFPGGALEAAIGPFVDGAAIPAAAPGMSDVLPDSLRSGVVVSDADALWAAVTQAAASGHRAVTVRLDPATAASAAASVARVLATAIAAVPADASPTGGTPAVSFPAEVPVKAAELVVASDLSTRVVFHPLGEGRLPGAAMVATFSEEPRNLRLYDPKQPQAAAPRVVRSGARWAAEVPLVRRPLVLAWERARSDEDLQADVAVSTTVDPTVEEILARHFAAQAGRDRALKTYVADVSTEMRYEFGASGQAFDVRVEGRYFVDVASGLREIENQRWFINGARYDPRKGRPPEMPLLQPEKVQVTPLELRLDKSYEYRLLGRDTREGRPCWKVAFKPTVKDLTAYAGTVWIDAQTFDRVAVDLVQTRLEAPILTNEQSDRFGAVLAEDGEHWLVRESRIHRTVSLLGGTVAIQMRLLFSGFRVNAPDFAALRQSALDSPHQMLRETDEGLKYLRPAEGGGREVGETATHKIFVALGARYDEAFGGLLPLAGVNYLDYDLGGSDLQLNVFAAGAINTVSIADPSLFGSRVSLGMDAFLPVVRKKDRIDVPGSGVDEGETVRGRIPRLELEVSRPAGRHGRVAGTASIARESWSRDDDTDAGFVEPSDTWVGSVGVKGEIHARGWDARLRLQRFERSEWEAWGYDTGSGPPPLPSGDSGYWKWNAGVSKTWPLSKLQNAGFEAQYLGGRDLDRFSQYEFSAFGGTRLAGFDGSAIHFDSAALLRLSYGLEVGGLFGAKIEIGAGRTWNESLPASVVEEFGEDSDHVGIALTGNVPGPLGTLIRFDVGTALWSSDHDEAEGNIVAQVIVLKLLGR